MIEQANKTYQKEENPKYRDNLLAMKIALEALLVLAGRYADIAHKKMQSVSSKTAERYSLMERTLRSAPYYGAKNLYEAIQLFILAWQCMCIEQQTNPFAFSVGNADRIFEPYRKLGDTTREEAAGLFEHLLVFFNVDDRSWAISQNIIIGGKGIDGTDLSNICTYAFLDAFYAMNLP